MLNTSTIASYQRALEAFRAYVRLRLDDRAPDAIEMGDVLVYVEHLRAERGNGDAVINRHVVILRSFYRAMLHLLYGTGIRAVECANLCEMDVALGEKTVRVRGKGGREPILTHLWIEHNTPTMPTATGSTRGRRPIRGRLR